MPALRPWPWLLGLGLVVPSSAAAHYSEAPGSLVAVSVELDGRTAPLYPAPDSSGRHYLEARAGSRYSVRLANRTGERLGVVLVVDGLNAVSGERDPGADRRPSARPGRMYVLDPWDATEVQGWRTSLEEVRQFTFVDERASYAARSGKANRKMGWIEVVVYRERRPYAWRFRPDEIAGSAAPEAKDEERRAAPPATAPPAAAGASPEAQERAKALGYLGEAPAPRESYPGTGWGPRAHDPVVLVDFQPAPNPAECVTLRYEYASALRALGILPRPWHDRDRLRERERAIDGFAKPPRW